MVTRVTSPVSNMSGCFLLIAVGLILPLFNPWLSSAAWAQSTDKSSARTWTDATGKFKFEAMFVEVDKGIVVLEQANGVRKRIPLKKLSKADQTFLEEVPSNPFDNVTTSSTSNFKDVVWKPSPDVDWDSVPHVSVESPLPWNVPVDPVDPVTVAPKVVLAASKKLEMDPFSDAVIDLKDQVLVVGHASVWPSEGMSRLSVMNLDTGNVVQTEIIKASMKPIATWNKGRSVLMIGAKNNPFDRDNQAIGALEVWNLNGKRIQRTVAWTPFGKDRNHWNKPDANRLRSVDRLSTGELVTLSHSGHLAVWDLETQVPKWHSRLEPESQFALSPNKQLLAIVNQDLLMFVDSRTGKVHGVQSFESRKGEWRWSQAAPNLVWSPNGETLLLQTFDQGIGAFHRLRLYRVKSGELKRELFGLSNSLFSPPPRDPKRPIGNAGELASLRPIQFTDEDHLLLSNRWLLDLSSRLVACQYDGAQHIVLAGGHAFIFHEWDRRGWISVLQMPHADALQALHTAKRNPDRFVLTPETAIDVTYDQLSSGYQTAVAAKLEKMLSEQKIKVVKGAELKLVPSISAPIASRSDFFGAGQQSFVKLDSTLMLMLGPRRLWTATTSNFPTMTPSNFGRLPIDIVMEQSGRPEIDFFGNVLLPTYLQRNSDPSQSPEALILATFDKQGAIK